MEAKNVLEIIRETGDWEVPSSQEDSYTANQMIAAYSMGKEVGKNEEKERSIRQLQTNLDYTADYTIQVIEKLAELGIETQTAHMRFASPKVFDVLVVVDEGETLKPDFLKIYDFTHSLKSSVNNINYNISFMFVENCNNLDEASIFSDGYIFSISQDRVAA
ncbi:MAG: hypothetical protein V4642_07165 [Bacteroidota bacterium]